MDNLKSLMSCIDGISNVIPEGTYLEMCDNLKIVHDNMPKVDDPPMRESRRLRVAVPFQVVQPDVAVHRLVNPTENSESESDEPIWYDEWIHNEDLIRQTLIDLKITKMSLRTLKPIQLNTKKVREAAMRHFTSHTPILEIDIFEENVSVAEATFENYVRIVDWSEFSPADKKEFTSKKFERQIYENYKMVENHRIERLIGDAVAVKRSLEIELDDMRDRQDYLRGYYNL